MEYEVSAIALSEQHDFAYVILNDSPFYSMNALRLPDFQFVLRFSTADTIRPQQFKQFLMNYEVSLVKTTQKLLDLQLETNDEQQAECCQMNSLNQNFESLPVVSMQTISVDSSDCLVCSFPDGKVLTFWVDIQILHSVKDSSFPPQLRLFDFD